jgi:hypothetical protein
MKGVTEQLSVNMILAAATAAPPRIVDRMREKGRAISSDFTPRQL